MNRRAQLIEIVEVILPLLVDDVERDQRQQSISEALTVLVGDGVQTVELLVERRTPGLDTQRLRFVD